MDILATIILFLVIGSGYAVIYGIYWMLFKVAPTDKDLKQLLGKNRQPHDSKGSEQTQDDAADCERSRLRLAQAGGDLSESRRALLALQQQQLELSQENARLDRDMLRLLEESARRQREDVANLEAAREAKRAAGKAEVVSGRIVVIRDVANDLDDAYNFTNTSSDRAGLPNVTDISSTSPFGLAVVGLFTDDTFYWQGVEFSVSGVKTTSQWIESSGLTAHKPAKEFINTEFGVAGNPTHRRR